MATKPSSPKPKPAPKTSRATSSVESPAAYTHPEQQSAMRPDVGTQDRFREKKAPTTYRYDSSLSPALDWDGQNGARELGEWLLACIEEAAALPAPHRYPAPREFRASTGAVVASVQSLAEAVAALRRLGQPFLTWTGKAERLSFDVPTMPLFVHERLSTRAIVETLVGHKHDKRQSLYLQRVRATADVDYWTSKDVREVLRIHFNYVVAYLVIETKGFDDLAEVKAAAARRWVAAVNEDGHYGRWRYEMARSVGAVREILDAG